MDTPDTPLSDTPFGQIGPSASIDRSARQRAPLPELVNSVTEHTVTIGGERISFSATAKDTVLYSDDGEPIGTVFSYAYVKTASNPVERPVIFITGGGPGATANCLHTGWLGPWAVPRERLTLTPESQPKATPPYFVSENEHSLLDTADLVFIDPIGTGYSIPLGRGASPDFWGLDEDADCIAQFVHRWICDNGRWNSPKFFLGESYGGTRACLVANSLMGGPTYQGVARCIALNGVISLSNGLGLMGLGNAGIGPIQTVAATFPTLAAIAWYYEVVPRGSATVQQRFAEALDFAMGPYLEALHKEADGTLERDSREVVVNKLVELTGLPKEIFVNDLSIPSPEYCHKLIAARGRFFSMYDARFSFVETGRGGDPFADDPALARIFPIFSGALHNIEAAKLNLRVNRQYVSVRFRDLIPAWNMQHRPQLFACTMGKGTSADDLALAMDRNPDMRVMLASGMYDLVIPAGMAHLACARTLPQDRTVIREYAGGHNPYLDEETTVALSNDVRAFIRSAC